MNAGPFSRGSGAFSSSEVELVLTGATLPGGLTWDGQTASVSTDAP
jgi:hypothetical protein